MANKVYSYYQEQKHQELDKRFIYDIFDEMMGAEPELMPFIDDFRIVEAPTSSLGSYSNENRCIKINRKLIEEQPVNSHFLAIEVVRHELEHARNLKNLYAGKDDIESLVISYALRSYAMQNGMNRHFNIDRLDPFFLGINTKANYETDPGERLAEIKAWKYMVNLLKNQRTSDDLLKARTMLYYSYIRGYKDNRYYMDAPTYEFLLKTGMHHEYYWLKNRVAKKDYSFDTRITYGLPITYPEHEDKVLKKVLLQKRKK